MKNYVLNLKSGVKNRIDAKTLAEAKKEAIRQASYGGGMLQLCFKGSYYYADIITFPGGFRWEWKKI